MKNSLHIFKGCGMAIDFLKNLLPHVHPQLNHFIFNNLCLKNWLHKNCTSNIITTVTDLPWSALFFFSIWNLRKKRNHNIFHSSESTLLDPLQMIKQA